MPQGLHLTQPRCPHTRGKSPSAESILWKFLEQQGNGIPQARVGESQKDGIWTRPAFLSSVKHVPRLQVPHNPLRRDGAQNSKTADNVSLELEEVQGPREESMHHSLDSRSNFSHLSSACSGHGRVSMEKWFRSVPRMQDRKTY